MARRHGAELEVDSAVGAGTTIRLVFPVATTTATAELPASTAAQRRQRILLVDDDPLLIKSMRDILEADGHVVTATDGERAGISAFEERQRNAEPFSLVITDLGMPYVDGRKVAAAIRALSPHTPIILLTGWGQRLRSDQEVPPGVTRVLSKPPKLQELRAALAELGMP